MYPSKVISPTSSSCHDFVKSLYYKVAQDHTCHIRRRSLLELGVTVILSALVDSHLLNSGDATSSSKAFSVDSLVNASHSAAEYFLLSGVVCMMDGYNSSDSFLGGVLVKTDDEKI